MHAKLVGRALILSGLALAVIVGVAVVAYQQRDLLRVRYFSETGHAVREPFLTFFDTHGGIGTFGFPLTEAYTDRDGTLAQTFQRARLQLTVRGVELAAIGTALRLGDAAGVYPVDHLLAGFYDEYGGEGFFGRPLAASHVENGLLVQDFERARLVLGADGNVHLANLGSAYLIAFPPPDESGRAAIRLYGTPTPPPALKVNVSVARPTVEQGGQQTIYLYVEDEQGNPVEGAQALALLRYDGSLAEVELAPTDARGFASAAFIVPPATAGTQVIVEAHVLLGELFLTVETTYFQWW